MYKRYKIFIRVCINVTKYLCVFEMNILFIKTFCKVDFDNYISLENSRKLITTEN